MNNLYQEDARPSGGPENGGSPIDWVFLTPSAWEPRQASRLLDPSHFRVHHATTLGKALAALASTGARVLVTEVGFGDCDWEEVSGMLEHFRPRTAVVVVSPWIDERFWVLAHERGAYDVLLRPFDTAELQRVLRNAYTYATRSAPHTVAS